VEGADDRSVFNDSPTPLEQDDANDRKHRKRYHKGDAMGLKESLRQWTARCLKIGDRRRGGLNRAKDG
jgi:hypothetical protein